jgi:ABC-type glucose/galactose transport system permease subunit
MTNSSLTEVQKGKIAIAVIIALIGILIIYNKYSSSSLGKNFVIVNGIVTAAKVLNKVGQDAYYSFSINGKYYDGSQPLPKFKNVEDRFVLEGKMFPVVVDSTNYSNNKMLFDSLSFTRYGLEYPDSLKWLKQYLQP